MADEKATTKATAKADEKTTANVSTQEFYDEKVEEVKSGKKVVIDLTAKIQVKFVKDTKYIKASDKIHTISQSAFDIYNHKEKVVEKVN